MLQNDIKMNLIFKAINLNLMSNGLEKKFWQRAPKYVLHGLGKKVCVATQGIENVF